MSSPRARTPTTEATTPSRQTTRTGHPDTPSSRRDTPSRRLAQPTTPSSRRQTPSRRNAKSPSSRASSRTASRNNQNGDPTMDVSSPLEQIPPSSPYVRHLQGLTEIDLSSPLNYGTPSSTLGGSANASQSSGATPIRARSDIGSERHLRTLNVAAGAPSEPGSENGGAATAPSQETGEPQLVIWGTDVVVSECKRKFREMITTFKPPQLSSDEMMATADENNDNDEPYYMLKLQEIHVLEEPFLNVNCEHIRLFDANLYRQLKAYPQEVIPTLDMAVNELFFEQFPNAHLPHQIQVRPFNSEKTKTMRDLNPEDIDQLVTVDGMVVRTSYIIPEMRESYFRCSVCGNTETVQIDRGRIDEPTNCRNCATKYSFAMIHNRCNFTDKQLVKLQESPDDMPAGQTPATMLLYAHNDLVDAVSPGDRITVTGIYRAQPTRPNPKMTSVKAVYKTHIDVVHYRKIQVDRLHEIADDTDLRLTPERIEELIELSKKPDIYERLARSIAPGIYEHEDIKKGILLQLFGGTKREVEGKCALRSDINILLCGDPGTSKSQLLQFVYNIAPRSQYTSGKGSTSVGLTAYVTRDPDTRQAVLQTGALVLCDNGVCCIDEFDKMNDATRSILHEVMEQQTLSIAKAGIICQLNARASILAAANPVESQWNPNKTIIENIMLPATLLSRFDLIFLMLDPQNETYDRRLARHLVSLYYQNTQQEAQVLDRDLLKDYIGYARARVHPKLTPEATEAVIEAYVDMRRIGSGRGLVTAYPRQLESLIRLAEAHAKVRYSNDVELCDIEEAKRLYREALKQSATDPTSGKIDVSILTTGVTASSRKRKQEITAALKVMLDKKGKNTNLNYAKMFQEFKEGSQWQITREMFEDALRDLQDEMFLLVIGRNQHIRVC